jgi:hypothetical protein
MPTYRKVRTFDANPAPGEYFDRRYVLNDDGSYSEEVAVVVETSGLPAGAATEATLATRALESGGNLAAIKTAIGAITDEAVVTDANGTVVGFLRGIVKLDAGTNLIGKVGIDQTTPGTTNKVTTDPITATPTPYNVTLTNANTEYSQALPANCRKFEFQARTEATVRLAFVTGKVAASTAPYMTLKAGASGYDHGGIFGRERQGNGAAGDQARGGWGSAASGNGDSFVIESEAD